MKSKLTKKPDIELEQDDEESVEVEAGGPTIASTKKSKTVIILASAALATVVIYFFFFKNDAAKKQSLEEVKVPKSVQVAPSEGGKSPFELDISEDSAKENADILDKPSIPDVPTLPTLPDGSLLQGDQLVLAPEQKVDPQQVLPTQQLSPKQAPSVINQLQEQKEDQKTAKDSEIDQKNNASDPRYSPIIVFSGVAQGTPTRGVGYENNIVKLNQDPIDQLQKTQSVVMASYIGDRIHTIAQGKLFTAVLETAINTEIPGSVRAIISRDVYGESGNEVLISKGSRLFGSYSSQVSKGQARVQISWTRLIRPDGVDLSIAFNASDQFGRSGLSGEVDNKYGSVITNSLLTSILAVGGVAAINKILTNNGTTTTTTSTTGTTVTGSATNQAIADVSKTIVDTVGQILGNSINVTPVIRVPQGTKITVIVNSDITIPSLSKH